MLELARGQMDRVPGGAEAPTASWAEGEIVTDEYEIAVKSDAPPGDYQIEVGMYDPANLQRLPVLDPAGAVGDRILLGNVEIEQ